MENNILKLNPFLRIQMNVRDEITVLDFELFLENGSIEINNMNFLKILSFIGEGKERKKIENKISLEFELNNKESSDFINNLIDKKLLVYKNYKKEEMKGVEHWIERGWLDALMLHLSIKNIDYADDNIDNLEEENNKYFKNLLEKYPFPDIYKKYKEKPCRSLPDPEELPNDRSFEEILLKRRSHKRWSKNDFTEQQLSNILYYASLEAKYLRDKVANIINKTPNILTNASFSELEIYFFVHDVNGLKQGLYFYNMDIHSITLLKEGEFREDVTKMCIGQQSAGSGRITFVISCLWERYMYRYQHPMGYRSILVNISELAQKLIILCTVFNKSTFLTPALEDRFADQLLGVFTLEEAPMYVIAAG